MKEVYEWHVETDGRPLYVMADYREHDRMLAVVTGESPPEAKEPLRFRRSGGKQAQNLPLADVLLCDAPASRLLSARAAIALQYVLGRCGSFCPARLLDAPGEDYVLWVAKRVVDCLDHARGKIGELVDVYAFLPTRVPEESAFLLPESPVRVFVDGQMRCLVQASSLSGFNLVELWSEQRGAFRTVLRGQRIELVRDLP